ncbi:hypothetical protein Tco_1346185 [Tanacetum coccineum]
MAINDKTRQRLNVKIAKHEEQDNNKTKDQEHSILNDKSNLTDLMKELHQMNLNFGEVFSLNFIDSIKAARSRRVQDLTSVDIC